jgi:hypothetical protein
MSKGVYGHQLFILAAEQYLAKTRDECNDEIATNTRECSCDAAEMAAIKLGVSRWQTKELVRELGAPRGPAFDFIKERSPHSTVEKRQGMRYAFLHLAAEYCAENRIFIPRA